MEERRRFERLHKKDVAFLELEGEKSEMQLLDISIGGMRVFSPVPLRLGNCVKGEFRLFPNIEPFFIKGKVVWVQEKGKNWQVGIEFKCISTIAFSEAGK